MKTKLQSKEGTIKKRIRPPTYTAQPKKKMNVIQRLNEHSKNHSKEHMMMMRKMMRGGKTFKEAHTAVMKKGIK